MSKIGIITCARYKECGGGKCFRALRERHGGFSRYTADESVEIVGFASCGGCPGGNVEQVPTEFLKNGCTVVHLATGFVVGYPPCLYTRQFKAFIESRFGLPVVIGTHPIPMKYLKVHGQLPFWKEAGIQELAPHLFAESQQVMESYD